MFWGAKTVIRFAEEQICKYPNECCNTISRTIENLIGIKAKVPNIIDLKKLPLIEQWSENDAKKMAKNKYREQYLANENYFTHNNEQSSSEIVLGPLVDYSKGKFNQFEI